MIDEGVKEQVLQALEQHERKEYFSRLLLDYARDYFGEGCPTELEFLVFVRDVLRRTLVHVNCDIRKENAQLTKERYNQND